MGEIMRGDLPEVGPVYPFLPVKDLCKPALKHLSGKKYGDIL